MAVHHRLCWSLFTCGCFCAAALAQPDGTDKKYPNEDYFDFRGKPLPAELTLTPAGLEPFVKSEPEGLRVSLPKDRTDVAPVVVGTRAGIKGDFEITASIEILQAEQPRDGFGVGASLFINKADAPTEGATIARLIRPSGKDIVLWDIGFGKKADDMQFEMDTRPSTDKLFRLRLKRTGTQLVYLLGKGLAGEHFEELPSKEFGASNIKQVVVRVTTGGQRVPVDVRLIDLRIRSGATPATPIPAATPAAQNSRVWLISALCVGFTFSSFLVIVLGALLIRRSRADSAKSSQPS